MKSKKLVTLALVVVLVLSLAACSSSKPAASEPAAQPAAAEPTAAPTAEPTAAPTVEPTAAPTTAPTTAPAAAAPTTAPAAAAPAASGLKDGSYKASQDSYDEHGWKGQITIEVKGGKIASADFDYVNKDNKLKAQDQDYIKTMESVTKVNIADAMKKLESALVGKEDVSVNAVSGATTTSNDFKALAKSALKNAK